MSCTNIFLVKFWFACLCSVSSLKLEATVNPGCDNNCESEFPNLVHVRAVDTLQSIHIFAAASKCLSPPTVMIVRSLNASAIPVIDWDKLILTKKENSITIPNMTDSYGLSYFSIVDYKRDEFNVNLPNLEINQTTFMEYYLSAFEFSIIKYDSVPNPETGLLEIIFRSNENRNHYLSKHGGYIEIKVSIRSKPQVDDSDPVYLKLTPGLSFRVDLSFNNLNALNSDSQLAVGLVLFSNKTILPNEDFLDWAHTLKQTKTSKQSWKVSDVKLGRLKHSRTRSLGVLQNVDKLETLLPDENSKQDMVHFRANPYFILDKQQLKTGNKKNNLFVSSGPRKVLKFKQRQNLRKCIARAIYGSRFEQNFHPSNNRLHFSKKQLKLGLPVGMRLQYFIFETPGMNPNIVSKFMSWSVSLSLEPPKDVMLLSNSAQPSKEETSYWGMLVLNWFTFVAN